MSSGPGLLPRTMPESVACWFVLVFMALVSTRTVRIDLLGQSHPMNITSTSTGQHRRADSIGSVQVSQSGRQESKRAIYLSHSCLGEGKMAFFFFTAGWKSCPKNGRDGPAHQWQLQNSGE